MGYEPLGCRVAVIPEDPGAVSSGGIVIPELAQDRAIRSSGGGVVCGVGPMVAEAYCSVCEPDGTNRLIRPGDHVRYVTYAGMQFYNTNEVQWTKSTGGEDEEKPQIIAVLNDQDILAIWVDEKQQGYKDTKKRARKG